MDSSDSHGRLFGGEAENDAYHIVTLRKGSSFLS